MPDAGIVQSSIFPAQGLINTSLWDYRLPHPSQAGNCLIVGAFVGASSATVSVADDSGGANTWVPTTQINSGNGTTLKVFYALNVAAGTQKITINTGTHRYTQVLIAELYNIHPTAILDGENGRQTTGPGITSGGITTSFANSVVLQITGLDNWPTQHAPMAWTPDTGYELLAVEDTSYMCAQMGHKVTAGATDPTITSSFTPTGSGAVTKVLAFRTASQGSAAPAGVRVFKVACHSLENGTTYAAYTGTSFTFQIHVKGNALAFCWTGRSTNKPTTVVSTPSASWVSAGSQATDASNNCVWWWWALNLTPGLYSITVSGFGSTPTASMQNFLDLAGIKTVQTPVIANYNDNVTTVASGSSGDVTGPSITPAVANGLVLIGVQEDKHTVTGFSHGTFLPPDVGVYSGASGPTDGGLGAYKNPAASLINYTIHYSGYEASVSGPGPYCSQAIAFEPAPTITSYTLTCTPGNVPITGTSALVKVGHILTCTPGSVPITGTSAQLRAARVLTCTSGSVPITGVNANLRFSHTLTATPGSLPITGQNANLIVGRKLTCTPGNVPLTGTSASLKTGRTLTAFPGSVPITGSNAQLHWGHLLTCTPGNMPITGTSAVLTTGRERILVCTPGNIAISGVSAQLTRGYRLLCLSGTMNITGIPAILTSGRLVHRGRRLVRMYSIQRMRDV